MAPRTNTTSRIDSAIAEAEGKDVAKPTYEIGGMTWELNIPIPGFLTMKLLASNGEVSKYFSASIDMIYAALGEDQWEAWDKRMTALPAVSMEEVDAFMTFIIEQSTSRPTTP